MSLVTITIAAQAGTDTATIAEFFEKCLSQVGIPAEVTEDNRVALSELARAELAQERDDTFQVRLRALAGSETLAVSIATTQLPKESLKPSIIL